MLIAYLAILTSFGIGMFVTRNARSLLTPEQKLELIERFSRLRLFLIIPLLALVLLIYVKPRISWMVLSFTAFIAGIFIAKWITARRVGVPEAYLRALRTEGFINAIGLSVFLVAGLWPYYAR